MYRAPKEGSDRQSICMANGSQRYSVYYSKKRGSDRKIGYNQDYALISQSILYLQSESLEIKEVIDFSVSSIGDIC